ncbi:Sodium channel protein type 3 subunit alpha [Dirofilaria immitis]
MATLLLWINQAVFVLFFTILYQILSSALIVISLVQCSSKKPQIKDLKDKDDKNETPKNVHIPIPAEQIKDKQEKSSSPEEKIKAAAEEQYSAAEAEKEKGRLREAEEKHIEEIKPKIMKRNAKEERIARGKETRGKGDYPTMDDVLSDWDSEKDGKKKDKEDDDQKSKVNTNLEDVEEFRKNDDQKLMESGGVEEEKKKEKEGEKKETDSKRDDAGGTGKYDTKGNKRDIKSPAIGDSIKKVDKTAGSQDK